MGLAVHGVATRVCFIGEEGMYSPMPRSSRDAGVATTSLPVPCPVAAQAVNTLHAMRKRVASEREALRRHMTCKVGGGRFYDERLCGLFSCPRRAPPAVVATRESQAQAKGDRRVRVEAIVSAGTK